MSEHTPDETSPDRLPGDDSPHSLGESLGGLDGLDLGGLGGGGLGEALGGLDLGSMLEQAQQMQSQLLAAQQELELTTVDGSAGGVKVQLTGVGELHAVEIPQGSFDSSDADSLADLQDLIVAAYRDAKGRADALASEKLGPMAGGMGGGGLGGPEAGPSTGGTPMGFGGPGGSGV